MIAQVVCKDCDSETSVYGFVTREDLENTKLAYLLDTELKTTKDFDI